MHQTLEPAISVVLIAPDGFAGQRRTVRRLRKQTIRERIEVVIVAPSLAALRVDESLLEPFAAFQVVEVGQIRCIGEAYAAGVRAARAGIVALGEDHSLPKRDWAEKLLRAHQQPWAAVGPLIVNLNRRNLVSWADYFLTYGPWTDPRQAREIEHLPGHNSSYKRAVLLEYGQRLGAMMQNESLLHWDLRRRGYRLFFEPAAQTLHLCIGRIRSWVPLTVIGGRAFAAYRCDLEQWSWLHRLLFVLGSPLLPLVRFKRAMRQVRVSAGAPPLGRIAPLLAVAFLLDAVGQAVGCALGAGSSLRTLLYYEFDRHRHVGVRNASAVARAGHV